MKTRCYCVPVAMLLVASSGCLASQRIGGAVKKVAVKTPGYILLAAIDGALDRDETYSDRVNREEREEAWERYLRANPDFVPAMADSYSQ